ncbi:TMAO reductase system periplasmic protein TorT [Photobacterium sp. DNB23_23_1]|uniref:TMAO reductase system periplasmic protein TorT n=1 Tax=Photobacterium pectinilyticum TaxID=2906793 RepID=A0ABT1MZW5_9GAMM|nr:TMAO reductase system periplasmic protein TorT [Photobacterium sp. ZSDE20]MCQ1058015.1 TMAO reductase system periplasmic protein TorT [Photobacterium sp. ZSDE20]MDD1822548.1 TMAO reductase system periplasmic protein TorT [Photobacterium sp. ZSDE20]
MIKTIAMTLLAIACISQTAYAAEVIAYPPSFETDKQAKHIQYQPLEKARKPWKLCAVYPHLKDSYWLSVNYGMVEHAKKLGVELKVLEAGGYPNLEKQQSQLTDCREWQADAIILGTVDSLAYDNRLTQLTDDIPVFATINYLDTSKQNSSDNVIARVGVDWYQMGYRTGEFLANRHPSGSGMVNVALLPGPQKRGGTKPVVQGFYDATESSDIHIVTTLWADHSKELQRNLIQQLLASDQHFDYIVGGAVSAEVAISELRAKDLTTETKILSTYLSHGVYRGLLRGKILFAPTDKMAQQAMLSVDQAVRYLEGKPLKKDLAPILALLTPENLDSKVIAESLSPAAFRPVFHVEAP